MSFQLIFLLCCLKVVYACDVDNGTITCCGLNLTEIPRPYDLISDNNTLSWISFNLSYNLISSTADLSNWSDCKLEDVDLSYNKLLYIDSDSFSGLNYLKMVNLSHNQLKRVNFSRSFLSTVKYLDISYNVDLNVSVHDVKMIAGSSLIKLDLSSTKVSLPSVDVFTTMNSLLILELSYTGLTYVPDIPANLQYLNFSGNHVTFLDPRTFANAKNLKTLILERNSLLSEVRYSSFNPLLNLQKLSFRGCSKLSHLPSSLFQHNKHLENLSLAHCNFRNISISYKTTFLSLKWIELDHNPWHCGPEIKWFIQLDDNHILSDSIRCATPENMSLAEFLGPRVKHQAVRILLTVVSIILFGMLIVAIAVSCRMENRRRKTLTSYSPLEQTSKPYRGSFIYVTSSV